MSRCYNRLVRRLLAILIAALVALPAISPVFALSGENDPARPACCRRDGKHHCMLAGMATGGSASSGQPSFTAAHLSERCPYGAKAMPGTARTGWTPRTCQAVFAGFVSHPGGIPQTECRHRISADRSRHKRGPPSSLLAA